MYLNFRHYFAVLAVALLFMGCAGYRHGWQGRPEELTGSTNANVSEEEGYQATAPQQAFGVSGRPRRLPPLKQHETARPLSAAMANSVNEPWVHAGHAAVSVHSVNDVAYALEDWFGLPEEVRSDSVSYAVFDSEAFQNAGQLHEPSRVRPVTFQTATELPAPLSGVSETEELPPPHPSVNDVEPIVISTPPPNGVATELIALPIPPRPPGRLKRWLSCIGFGHLIKCEPCVAEPTLALETPLFSPSGTIYAPDHWWTSFGNAALDQQVLYSLGGNFTLDIALHRLAAADALARREASDLWPDLNGFATGEGTFRTFAPNDSRFALGLDASYQVDLWGQIESRVEAQRLRASATGADYQAVALTLTAEIARTWFSLIEAHAQIKLLNQQLKDNITGLKLQEGRFGGGDDRVGSADVLRQRQLVESTREQIIVARSRIDVLEHRLAVLEGRPPQQATYDVGDVLPSLPPLPATGLPSELVQRRPDVQRDYLALLAADRDLASAITAKYPRLDLAGSLSTVADNPANLFRDWILVIAGQLVAPIIDGGERQAEVDRTAAVLQQLVANYGQTVLVAFSEVEDALALERYQRQRLESLNAQLRLAEQAAKELWDRYSKFGEVIGETDYLDVLTATRTEQQLQRDVMSARLDLILTRISLYLALAGSFDTHSLPYAHPAIGPGDRFSHECYDQTPIVEALD